MNVYVFHIICHHKKKSVTSTKEGNCSKKLGKIEETAESSVGNPSLLVGLSIIGLLALRINHTYVPKFYLEEKEEREEITLQLYS